MSIEKLIEFASETDAKNTDNLTLIQGFPSRLKPARQWFNWLFNSLTVKINEIIDGKLDHNSAAVSADKLTTSRNISITGAVAGSSTFDGSGDLAISTTLEGFINSKTTNGYTHIGNGLILQWGEVTETGNPGEASRDVEFPIPFPTNCLNVNLSRVTASASGDNSDGGVALHTKDNEGFVLHYWTAYGSSDSSLRGALWFAIGY